MKEIIIETLVFFPFLYGPLVSYQLGGITDMALEGVLVFIPIIIYNFMNQNFLLPLISIIPFLIILLKQGENRNILSSIIILTYLQSINLILLKTPIQSLLDFPILSLSTLIYLNIFLFVLFCVVKYSKTGLLFRGYKFNRKVLKNVGKGPQNIRLLIYLISYLFIGISGIIMAMHQQFLSIYMGLGNLMLAIGFIVIGKRVPVIFMLCLFYFTLYHLFVYYGFDSMYLKASIALIFASFLLKKDFLYA